MKLKHMLLGSALLVVGAIATPAQSVYVQEAPVLCTVATLQCHVPLLPDGSGNIYSTGAGASTFYIGAHFVLMVGGTTHQGSITAVNRQFPGVGTSGTFDFSFSTQDGLTGTVTGQGHWTREYNSRWWWAEIDSSTVTVN